MLQGKASVIAPNFANGILAPGYRGLPGQVQVNKKTVTAPSTLGPGPTSIHYHEITDHQPATTIGDPEKPRWLNRSSSRRTNLTGSILRPDQGRGVATQHRAARPLRDRIAKKAGVHQTDAGDSA
jgi:hypothetical protein